MSSAILLSGGIDSIALTYWKKPEFAITINYGQASSKAELRVSKTICELLNIKHIIVDIDCRGLGSGDLLNSTPLTIAPSSEWWPFRNQLLVTLAAMKAVSYGIKELMLGSVLSDDFHKDGTEGFYSILNTLMNYQEGNISISAPAVSLTSSELVHISKVPSDLLFYAHSCHKSNVPCGHCRGCYKYIEVIQNLRDANW